MDCADLVLADLDRVLASLPDDPASCKIATKPTSPRTSESLAPSSLDRLREGATLVGAPTPTSTPTPTTSLAPLPTTPLVTSSSSSSPSHVLPVVTSSKPSRGRRLQAGADKIAPALLKPWRSLWAHEKLAVAFDAAEGTGIAFTLNLSLRLQATLEGRSDPARLMGGYIARELRRTCGALPFGFTFEIAPGGRLHLHGVVVPASFDEDHVRAIDAALMKSGGRLERDGGHRLTSLTQSHLDHLRDGLGWFAYCQKAAEDVAQILGTHQTSYISTPLRALAEAAHKARSKKS